MSTRAERKADVTGTEEGLGARLAGLLTRGPGGWRTPRSERDLELLETLNLGGRRQLLLVSCGGERFLVGAGADGISAIVPAGAAGAQPGDMQAGARP